MPAKLAEADQMTIEEFLAFTDQRPGGERWELIEGMAIMNASPTQWHQRIALNIAAALDAEKIAQNAQWTAFLGVGTHVPISPNSLPQPDIYVQEQPGLNISETDDALVIFEILSSSNTRADKAWRKRVYASVPNCQHDVTVSTKSAEIVRFDRSDGWKDTTLRGLDATLDLAVVNALISLRDVYRWTPLQ